MFFFLLCVLYTADWKLCVFHCFFPWIFRKNCMAVHFRVAFPFPSSIVDNASSYQLQLFIGLLAHVFHNDFI